MDKKNSSLVSSDHEIVFSLLRSYNIACAISTISFYIKDHDGKKSMTYLCSPWQRQRDVILLCIVKHTIKIAVYCKCQAQHCVGAPHRVCILTLTVLNILFIYLDILIYQFLTWFSQWWRIIDFSLITNNNINLLTNPKQLYVRAFWLGSDKLPWHSPSCIPDHPQRYYVLTQNLSG